MITVNPIGFKFCQNWKVKMKLFRNFLPFSFLSNIRQEIVIRNRKACGYVWADLKNGWQKYLLGGLNNYNRRPNGWILDLQFKKKNCNEHWTFCLDKQSNSFPLNFLNSQLKHKRVYVLPTRQVGMWTLHTLHW